MDHLRIFYKIQVMTGAKMTELAKIIKRDIAANGPMDVGRFMALALGHPEHGYYMKQDPFGAEGDFTTAPEISQMFGEMIGAWAMFQYSHFDGPFTLLECGPGRGTLMADMLRVGARVPEFIKNANVALMEMSPVLKAKQQERLQGYNVRWVESLEEVPDDKPIIAVANEFLDALPIRQYERIDGQSYERVITEDLTWGRVPAPLTFHQEGIHELSPAREGWMQQFCALLNKTRGVGLFIDYGHWASAPGDTIQGVYKHEYCDVLEHIGDADLTSHVDFQALQAKAQAADLAVQTTSQGDFLRDCGIEFRARALMQKADDKQAEEIQSALHRLTHPDEMGELFKVFEVRAGVRL